ncbi:MAG TPA: hypothetical protein VIL28_12480 [Steroidobacteraceae bacterium]
MKKQILAGAVAAIAMCSSAVSFAAAPPFVGEATLAKPVAEPVEVTIDGVLWRCEGVKCSGRAERRSTLDSHVKECRKVAEVLGELTEYSSRGREMTKGSVATCNRLAAAAKEEMVASK